MTEKVLIRLDDLFRLEIEAVDPEEDAAENFQPVNMIQELTPYGMMLAGVGSCTAMVVMSYAENHQIKLDQVEICLEYERMFKEDCDDCVGIERYDDHIYESLTFRGDLDEKTRDKLRKIAHHCPLEKMLQHGGVEVKSGSMKTN